MELGPDFYIIEHIFRTKDNFLILGHNGPDLDCIGSQMSIAYYLKSLNKNVFVVNKDNLSPRFNFLDNLSIITNQMPVLSLVEVVVVLDSSLWMTGFLESHPWFLKDFTPIIEIDHHKKALDSRSYHIHKINISSVSEIIFYFFENVGFEYGASIANYLLAGIYGDTNGFLNTNVFESTMYAVSELLKRGAQITPIIENVLARKTIPELLLWSRAFSRLKLNSKSKIAHTFLSFDDIDFFSRYGEISLSALSNFLSSIKEADLVMLLSERERGIIRGSLRSIADVDVSKIAKFFSPDGGGHTRAAGFSIPGTFMRNNNHWQIVENKQALAN